MMRYLLFAILLLPATASAQQVTSDLNAKVEGWPRDDRCYQHQLAANANVGLEWGRVTIRSWMTFTWWAACDSKIKGAILNAEAGKVLERQHGVTALLRVTEWVTVGAFIERDAVHHFWRSKRDWRHDYFPHDNSWRGAERRCKSPKGVGKVSPHAEGVCPSIGYWDAVGPLVMFTFDHMRIRLDSPTLHWKELTLPSPALRWRVEAFQGFRPYLIAQGSVGDDGSAYSSAEVGYQLTETIRVGVAGGTVGAPGWRSNLNRVAFVIRAD